MAEIPEHLKAKALEAARAIKTDEKAIPAKHIAINDPSKTPDWTDEKGLQAMREQKRLEALQDKKPDPPKSPDKG